MIWSNVLGWFDYADLYDLVVAKFPGGTLVEVGNFLGRSLCYLGATAKASGKPYRLIGVDTCRGSDAKEPGADIHAAHLVRGTFAGTLHANVIDCGIAEITDLMVMPSLRAASLLPDASCDFVFIDASHDYANVSADVRAWLPKVKPGGWIAGHDYDDVWPEVRRAVRDLLPGHTTASRACWLYEKH